MIPGHPKRALLGAAVSLALLACRAPEAPPPTATPPRPTPAPTATASPVRTPNLTLTAEAARRSVPPTQGPTVPQQTATAVTLIAEATAFARDLRATVTAQERAP
jgi:hypothetical protein